MLRSCTGLFAGVLKRFWMVLLSGTIGFLSLFAMMAQAAGPPPQPNREDPATTAAQEYPEQKGAPAQRKLEAALGPVRFRFYGQLLLNISASDETVVGGDVPLWAVPGTGDVTFPDGSRGRVHDLFITARQTVLGVQLSPNETVAGWAPGAVVEFDFFGSRPADAILPQGRVFNQPRLRLAYLQLTKGTWKFVAGQDKVIIAPLDPISLSHVSVPLGATAGNLWGWLPQVRVEKTQSLGEKTEALFQLGILRPEFADRRLGDTVPSGVSLDNSTAGTRSTMPFYQARLALSHPLAGSTATIGAGAHYGREVVGVNHGLDSWAFALDFRIPFHPRVILRGESYVGSNLIPFQGGIDQGVAAIPAAAPFRQINKIGDAGGWGELTFRVTTDDKNHAYIGWGTDNPVAHTLLPGSGLSKNSFYWASYFRKLTRDTTVALEWSNWQFRTKGFIGNTPGPRGPFGRANVFNVSFAYRF